MYIKNTELLNFRNYSSLSIDFSRGVNIITGDNAQGKTNLLESLFVLSLSRSFRTSKDSEMIRFGEDAAKVKASVIKDDNEHETVEIIYTGKGKSVKINDVLISSFSELLENIFIVIFSPEDLRIVKDDPEKRRRFINRELSQLSPLYYSQLVKYNRILKQRNAFLKNDISDYSLLDIWDDEISDAGHIIMKKRAEFTEKLNMISSEIHSRITGGKEGLKISYEPDIDLNTDEYRSIIQKSREKDILRRTTTRGIQRDDIKIEADGKDIRKFGSQGQQRTAALSLKLAELELIKEETGENAVLLLDDVLSELDVSRQTFLIDSLKDIQLFITTAEFTDELASSFENARIIKICDGKVTD